MAKAYMFLLLFFVFLVCCPGFQCYNDVAMKNEIMFERILSSYVKPIKQLSEKFPNHEVELQIEFQRAIPQIPRQAPQRRFGYKQPTYLPPQIDTSPETTTTTSTTSTTTEKPDAMPKASPTKNPERRLVTTTESPGRRPVYLDDLQKVFDEFADKIKSTKCTGDHHGSTNEYPQNIVISNPGPVTGNRNLDEVVDMIRKGVHVRKHVPRPTDEDLDWLQIKIPA